MINYELLNRLINQKYQIIQSPDDPARYFIYLDKQYSCLISYKEKALRIMGNRDDILIEYADPNYQQKINEIIDNITKNRLNEIDSITVAKTIMLL